MSVLDWFHRPALAADRALGTEAAARLAAIHGTAFARPWSTLEFERLLGERGVVADGLFLGRTAKPRASSCRGSSLDEAEILTVAIAPASAGQGPFARRCSHGISTSSRRRGRRKPFIWRSRRATARRSPSIAASAFGRPDAARAITKSPTGHGVAALTMALGL